MSVRIVHGANEGRFTLTGKTVSQIRHSLRDAFNIPEDAQALVGGGEVSGDHIVADGETVEFVRIFGRKGGLHDLWSEAEVQQFFSGKEMDELLKAGLQFTLRPTLTSEEIIEWSHRLRSREQQQVHSIPVSVDIERETVDTINRLIEEGMVEEKVVDGETHVRLTKKGKEATGSDRTNAATFDDEERFRINGQKDCPECGDKLGSVSNQQCCLESIFRNIVDEGIEKQIAKGKEPCVWHEDVKEEIGRRVHPDILVAKGMEEEDVDSEVGDE